MFRVIVPQAYQLFNDISLPRYDIISVPSYAAGIYHRTKCDIISKIYHPFRKERISLKKVTFVGRQKWLFPWSRIRESNPPSRLGKCTKYAGKELLHHAGGATNFHLATASMWVNCHDYERCAAWFRRTAESGLNLNGCASGLPISHNIQKIQIVRLRFGLRFVRIMAYYGYHSQNATRRIKYGLVYFRHWTHKG